MLTAFGLDKELHFNLGKMVDTTEQSLYYDCNQIIKRCEKMSNYSLTGPESGNW